MGSVLFKPELTFNTSVFQDNEANRWKFLEKLEPVQGNDVGFLLSSPMPVLTMTATYLLFVCFVGPLIMRNREPFQLKSVIRFYNLSMVFLAGYLLYRLYDAVETLDSFLDCRKAFSFSDESASKIYKIGNFILAVRLSEYLDTIFFTLRKKDNQVTFLHVFHHAFVPMYAFWILRTAPVRFNVYIILINSFIHVLMYFYYFLATYQQSRERSGPTSSLTKRPEARQSFIMVIVTKLLMFKRYMTQLQILQFVTLAIYAIQAGFRDSQCGVPWTYIIANLLLAFGFLSLFLHFYMQVYKSSGGSRKKE